MRLERKQLRIVLILGGLALFGAAVAVPTIYRKVQLKAQIEVLRAAVAADSAATKNLSDLAERVAQLERLAQKSTKELPDNVQLASLLSDLTEQIQVLDLRDSQITQGKPERDARFHIHPVELRFRSTFPGAFTFLRHMEAMNRLVRVNRVMLELEKGPTSGVGVLNVEIDMDAFSAPTEAPQS